MKINKITLIALATTALSLAGGAVFAQGNTTPTVTTVDYSQLFAEANPTQYLLTMGSYVGAAAVAFGGLAYAVRWVHKFLGH